MTESELIDEIASRAELTRIQTKIALDHFRLHLALMIADVNGTPRIGEIIRLQHFGTFFPRFLPSRTAWDVETQSMQLRPACYRVGFWPSKSFESLPPLDNSISFEYGHINVPNDGTIDQLTDFDAPLRLFRVRDNLTLYEIVGTRRLTWTGTPMPFTGFGGENGTVIATYSNYTEGVFISDGDQSTTYTAGFPTVNYLETRTDFIDWPPYIAAQAAAETAPG